MLPGQFRRMCAEGGVGWRTRRQEKRRRSKKNKDEFHVLTSLAPSKLFEDF